MEMTLLLLMVGRLIQRHTDNVLNGVIAAKEHLNVVFIGHVDAGKSTMGGRILVECGMVVCNSRAMQ